MNEMVQAAKCYSEEHGLPLALYDSDEKRRIGNKGKGITPDSLEKIIESLIDNPDLNLGMVPGDGIAVVDFDVKPSKADQGRNVEKSIDFLLLPEAPTVDTPSGGKHAYFRVPFGLHLKTVLDLYKNHPEFGDDGTGVRRKVDFLALNHAGVILPPSSFASGKYSWEIPLGSVEMLDLPLRLLLIPKWNREAVDKKAAWMHLMEKTSLQDGDYRNGVLISFISKLFYTLRIDHGNSIPLSMKAAIEETRKINAAFSTPLDHGLLEGIIRRFENYASKNNLHREDWMNAIAESTPGPSANEIDWANVLTRGVSDGENYTLYLQILGKEVHFECTAKQMEDPEWIARTCRHHLMNANISCEYAPKKMKPLWITEVLGKWFERITPTIRLSLTDRVADLLAEYCSKPLDAAIVSAPYKQTDSAVRDGDSFFIPLNGLTNFVKKKIGKEAAQDHVQNALINIGASVIRKGMHRGTFYHLSAKMIYGTNNDSSETRNGKDNLLGGEDTNSSPIGSANPIDEFWEEERTGSSLENNDPSPSGE